MDPKESEIQPTLQVKVYRPNEDEFRDMAAFLRMIEADPENQKVGLVKVIPPDSMKSNPLQLTDDYMLKNCVVQRVAEMEGSARMSQLIFKKETQMSLGEFKALAKTFEKPGLDQTELENIFWEDLQKRRLNTHYNAKIDPTYAIDNEQSLFVKGFSYWNLNEMTERESVIHVGEAMPGINTPFLNVGMFKTCFGIHIEDANMASINKLHDGKPKTWIAVPSSQAPELEKYVQANVSKTIDCNRYIRHKTIIIPPSELIKYGIDFAKVVQEEGEYIVTLYNSYHQGYNNGYNYSEAVNYATAMWADFFYETTLCSCNYSVDANFLKETLSRLVPQKVKPGSGNRAVNSISGRYVRH